MGWQEARAKHKLSGPLNDQKVEDLVARRVLRGLGYVAKQLPELERALGFRDTWDDPMWPRVRKVLGAVAWASNVKVFPLEYKRALGEISAAKEAGDAVSKAKADTKKAGKTAASK